MTKKVMICGGGSGGHIFPGIAACHALAARNIAFEWLGCAGGMEEQLIPPTGIKLHLVQFDQPGASAMAKAKAVMRAKDAAKEAAGLISESGASAVLGMGGYPSLPGVLAALSMKLPRLIHEQNAKLGWANLALLKLSTRVLVTYPDTTSSYAYKVGMPLRPEFANVPPPEQRFASKSGGLHILVLGGSQGASSLNAGIPAALAGAETKPARVVHQAGAGKAADTVAAYEAAGLSDAVQVHEFIQDMAGEMAQADLVVSRAGAGTIAEICSVGVASILIPYPHATSHQDKNAAMMVNANAAEKVADKMLADAAFMSKVFDKFSGRVALAEKALNARALALPDAAAKVAEHCEKVIDAAQD